jgi:hypothetical protein
LPEFARRCRDAFPALRFGFARASVRYPRRNGNDRAGILAIVRAANGPTLQGVGAPGCGRFFTRMSQCANITIRFDMASHMKTTIEIADALLEEAKAIAAEEGTTVRALVESGLRWRVAEHRAHYGTFRLGDESFGGEGIAPELRGASWERIRDLAYGNDA